MTLPPLGQRIVALREELASDPDSIVTGQLKEPASETKIEAAALLSWHAPYADLVRMFDGGRLGAFWFPGVENLAADQNAIELYGVTTADWLCVGRTPTEDVLLHTSGDVVLIDNDHPEFQVTRRRPSLATLLEDLTGPGYEALECLRDFDPWWRLLEKLGYLRS